ncbi:GDSL-type esterase/lipase family protein [Actinobaculum sp. 352]|uniref:SGNH/GDSL hydrolase family protein n=1 Tax=Actinobaculum sp. 352 TaxID=2490946 RepID=UPI000F7DB99A|nr:GDSL-type esterase/lipase family protein [Actinobaculum sp. 352]RTE50894.1 hypothetical protein EKN07_01830 [Actinobaculum sp. 352]
MNTTVRNLTGVGVSVAAAGIYRNAKAVAKQNPVFRRYWENHLITTLRLLDAAARADKELPLIYVALGDSAAQGLGADRLEDGYVPRIAAGLQRATGRPVALLNISLSGGTAASVLGTQLPQLAGLTIGSAALRPDIVTLDIGGNDVGVAGLTPEDFGNAMDQIARALPQPSFIADIPTFKPLRTQERASQLSAELTRAAKAHGCSVIELEALSNSFSVWEYMTKYHAADMFHPNTPWYQRWSQMFMDAISERLDLPRVDMDTVADWKPWRG